MEVTFYSFIKRINSTKIPTDNGDTISFTYKDVSDLHNPLIKIQGWNKTWNYAKINSIYYFVDSIYVDTANIFEVKLTIDLLATYYNEFKSSKVFALYSTSHYNFDLLDNRIVTSGKYAVEMSVGTQITNSEGIYSITAIAQDGSYANGLATTYYLDRTAMYALATEFNNPDLWESVKQWWESPIDAIVEVSWLPLSMPTDIGLKTAEIVIGAYVTGVKAQASNITATKVVKGVQWLDIPWKYNDFRNLEPYTQLELYFPGVGMVALNSNDFYGTEQLCIRYTFDLISGNIELRVYNTSGLVATASGNIKVSLPIGQVQTKTSSVINFGAGAVATTSLAVSGHPAAAVTSGAYAFSNVLTPREVINNGGINGSGINGNSINLPTLFLTYKDTNEIPTNMLAVYGGLASKVVTISQCTGYLQTLNASVACSAYETEKSRINTMLNGGVYIE